MVEIDVSRLIHDVDPNTLSGSIATHGKNAGRDTWNASLANTSATPLTEDHDGIRDWARGFGAWEDEEIDAWTSAECEALALQYAAGDLNELQALCPGEGLAGVDWAEAERMAEAGTVGGNLFASGERLFISLE